jgi:hypothetical protein
MNARVKFKTWEPEIGRGCRVSFCWWELMDNGIPDFGDNGENSPKFLGGRAEKSQETVVATVVAVWPAHLEQGACAKPISSEEVVVLPWLLTMAQYRTLECVHREFPMGKHDVVLKFYGGESNTFTVTPCRDSLFRNLFIGPEAPPLATDVLDRVELAKSAVMSLAERAQV